MPEKVCVKCGIKYITKSISNIYCNDCRKTLKCCVDGCENTNIDCVSKLLCSKHYAQYKRKDDICILKCKGCRDNFQNTSNSGRFYYCNKCRDEKCIECGSNEIRNFKNKLCKNCDQTRRRNSLKKTYNKICVICGIEFTSHILKQRFCSKECKSRNDCVEQNIRDKNKRREYKKLKYRECKICGVEFLPNRLCDENQKCCSQECRKIYSLDCSKNFYHKNIKPNNHLDRGQSFPQYFIFNLVKENFDFEWMYDCRRVISNPNTNRGLELDIWCPELKFAIEFDGEQHFKPKFGLKMLEKTKIWDDIKNKICKEKGIKLLRISYNDDWKDENWVINKVKEFLDVNNKNS